MTWVDSGEGGIPTHYTIYESDTNGTNATMTALVTVEASSLRRRKLGDVVGRSLWEQGSGGWGGNGSSYGKRRQPESYTFAMLDRIPCSVVLHLTVSALNDAGESAPAVPDSEALNRCFREPSAAPTASAAPTELPTAAPPTAAPSAAPTAAPTTAPTPAPSAAPMPEPSVAPTAAPTAAPSAGPSAAPSLPPSPAPSTATPSTAAPSTSRPTYAPTALPGNPTRPPVAAPTDAPSLAPSTAVPSAAPTAAPSPLPSPAPSTATPSTAAPSSSRPTYAPTALPGNPTRPPAAAPTDAPSLAPSTAAPSAAPTALPGNPTRVPAPRPSAAPTTAAPSAAPTAAPVEFAVAIDFVLPDSTVNSCEDTALELHDGSKVDDGFFAAALGLSEDAVETVATCGGATNFSRASKSVTPSRSRRRRLLAANATNATAAPNVTGCSEVRADVTMFDYEINAYLASLGRRLATYEDLADAEAAIQAMIEGYYGLNETAEATEVCGGFSVDVSVVYYPTPAPTSAPPSPPPSPAPSTATPSTAAPSTSRPTYAPTALPGNPTRPPAAAPTDAPSLAPSTAAPSAAPTALPGNPTRVPAPRPTAAPTTAAPSAAPTAAPVEFAVVVDFGLSDDSVDSCGDSKLELHDGMKINRKFFAAALGLSTDAVETVATCGDGRRRRLLAANATNATAAPTPMGCSDVRADITMFDYEIDAYLASLGRRLATYDHLGDTAVAIQTRIEEYYGLNETSEATEACGGLSVDVAVVYYPTPAPTDVDDDEIDTASLELPIWLLVVLLLTIAGILALPLAFMIDRYRSKHPVALTKGDRKALSARPDDIAVMDRSDIAVYADGEDDDVEAARRFPELTERDGDGPVEASRKSLKAKVAGLFGPGKAKVYLYTDGESRVEDEEATDADETAAPIVEVFPELTEPKERDGYAPRMVEPKSSKAKVAGLFGPGMAKVYIDGESRVEAKEEVKDAEATVADEAAAPRAAPDGGLVEVSFHGAPFDFSPVLAKRDDGGLAVRVGEIGGGRERFASGAFPVTSAAARPPPAAVSVDFEDDCPLGQRLLVRPAPPSRLPPLPGGVARGHPRSAVGRGSAGRHVTAATPRKK